MNQAHVTCLREANVTRRRRNLISQVLDWANNWDPAPICVSKQLCFFFSVLRVRDSQSRSNCPKTLETSMAELAPAASHRELLMQDVALLFLKHVQLKLSELCTPFSFVSVMCSFPLLPAAWMASLASPRGRSIWRMKFLKQNKTTHLTTPSTTKPTPQTQNQNKPKPQTVNSCLPCPWKQYCNDSCPLAF